MRMNQIYDYRIQSPAPAGDVTLVGIPDYLTIERQVITRGLVDLVTDVTGVLPIAKVEPAPVVGPLTITTVGSIDNLVIGNAETVLMNNATLATIRGFAAGYHGQKFTIVSIGAGQVALAHENAGSIAANRLTNIVTSGVTPLAPGLGAATYWYNEVTSRWKLLDHNQGGWISVAFDAANFRTNGFDQWVLTSGDQGNFTYFLTGDHLTISVSLSGTSVTGTADAQHLQVIIPNGWLATVTSLGYAYISDNGVIENGGHVICVVGQGYVAARRLAGNWSLSTNNTTIWWTFPFRIT